MKKFLMAIFGIYFLMSGLTAGTLTAEFVPVDFSADMVMKSDGQTMQGKIYASSGGSKIRMEMEREGQQMIMITRLDRNISYMVMPAQNMYMEPLLSRYKLKSSNWLSLSMYSVVP